MSAVEEDHRIGGLNIVWQRNDATVGAIEGQGRKSPTKVDWIRHTSSLICWVFELYHAVFKASLHSPVESRLIGTSPDYS